jgi:hypothetical protein
MSIIPVQSVQSGMTVSPGVRELPRDAVAVYARALAEARSRSFKVPNLSGQDSRAGVQRGIGGAEISRRSDRPSAARMFHAIRSLFESWIAGRARTAGIHELEAVLLSLDAHTLNDIGFDLMKETANDPRTRGSSALVQAVKSICENRLTAGS